MGGAVGALGAWCACRRRGISLPAFAHPDAEMFHPTFLYESPWSLVTAAVVVWVDRRFRLGHGRAFALYRAMYGTARALLELLRTDEANLLLGRRDDGGTFGRLGP